MLMDLFDHCLPLEATGAPLTSQEDLSHASLTEPLNNFVRADGIHAVTLKLVRQVGKTLRLSVWLGGTDHDLFQIPDRSCDERERIICECGRIFFMESMAPDVEHPTEGKDSCRPNPGCLMDRQNEESNG